VFDLPEGDDTNQRDVFSLALDGSHGGPVVVHPGDDVVMGWTPDATELLFASDRGGTIGLWAQRFQDRRTDGHPRLIRGSIEGRWSLGVTTKGSLYFGVRRNDRDISITSFDFSTGKQLAPPARPIRRFVGTNAMPDWSRDGRYLAYVSQRGFNPTNNAGRMISVRDTTSGEERDLYPKLVYFGQIRWSPDGGSLLMSGTDIKGRDGIFVVNARTGDVSVVAEANRGANPQWAPDGRHIFYRRGNSDPYAGADLIERDLATNEERLVVHADFAAFAVAPNGRSIVTIVGDLAKGFGTAIVQFDIESGRKTELLTASVSEQYPPYVAPQWMPSGNAVVVHKRVPNELWLVPTTGEPPRRINLDVREWSFGPVGQFSLASDGERIAFVSGSLSGEVMVLENFLPPRGMR
jgi:Tol biopolymer transport system component